MATKNSSARQPEEGNGDQPDFLELQRASKIIDNNVNEEQQRRLKMEAMADHGLVENTSTKQLNAKKQEDALALANQRLADMEKQLAEANAKLAETDAGKPLEQDEQPVKSGPDSEAPAIPPAPPVPPASAGAPSNPFA